MQIIRGKIPCAKKVVVYGPEGIGKSTFASHFPDPVFIDTEGSTKDMDVARLPQPSSWTMLWEEVQYIKTHPTECKTLIIDTMDWAEQMCVESVCNKHHKTGIEDFGYGNGYVYVKEELGKFLNLLEEVIKTGIHVVLNAHAQIRKFEQPDELGSYDRYELKLGKKTSSQTSPLVKEWADMVLFANYKTYSIAVDEKGKKHKAQGGTRVMFTTHHPCWDAKNRYGLPDEMPFEYDSIKNIIEPSVSGKAYKNKQSDSTAEARTVQEERYEIKSNAESKKKKEEAIVQANTETVSSHIDDRIPKALRDLMEANQIDEWDIQEAVAAKGYYPNDVPVRDYDRAFIDGVLVGAWSQVYGMIQQMKEKEAIPFN